MNPRSLLLLFLAAFSLCSCHQEEKNLEKFLSRLCNNEYNAASEYVNVTDYAQLSFFIREAYSKCRAEVEVKKCRLVENAGQPYLEATLHWKGIN